MVRVGPLLLVVLTSACWVTESEVAYKATLDVPPVPQLTIQRLCPITVGPREAKRWRFTCSKNVGLQS